MRAGREPYSCAVLVASVSPVEVEQPETGERVRPDTPWVTIVWNDPVNLMSYVTFVFQEYFGYPRATAEKLMKDVHEKGRAVVSSGTMEEMERDTEAMHAYGLWATFTQDAPA
jgi:ATP-dependent Clp protease adaptor protein ClpS